MISLVSEPTLLVAVVVFGVVLGALAWAVRRSGPLLVARTTMWALVATAAVALGLHASGLVPLDIPRWFYAVGLLPFVGPAVAVSTGRQARAAVRLVGVVCLPLGLVVAVLVVNQHYQYWPTLDALMGKDHTDPLLDSQTALSLATTDPDGPMATAATPTPATGRLVDIAIPGTVSGFHARPARIWLPPGYLTDPDRPRPVVVMVGGTPSWTSDWTRSAALDRAADALAAEHGGEAPLLVMVDANGSAFGDTECVGSAETYLTADVPAFVEAHFAVPADRAAWAIAGYSEGGTCAVTIALRHADRFAAFADLSGDARPDVGGHHRTVRVLFGGSEAEFVAHDPGALLASHRYPDLAGWFGSGHHDGAPRLATATLAAEARAAGLTVEEYTGPGGHDFGFVGHALHSVLPWLAGQLHADQTARNAGTPTPDPATAAPQMPQAPSAAGT